jgi:hypothetical protein
VRGSEAFGPQNQSLKASAETESGSVLGCMQFVVGSFPVPSTRAYYY